MCAIASGAREVVILEENPHRADIIRDHDRLPVINRGPRAFLAKSREKFDIIQEENWGPSIPGAPPSRGTTNSPWRPSLNR